MSERSAALASRVRSLSEVLRKTREELGLTQEQWAARLGVSVRTVSRWEQGEAEPRGAALKAAIATHASSTRTSRDIQKLLGAPALAAAGAAIAGTIGAAVGGLAGAWLSKASRESDRRKLGAVLKTTAEELDVSWDRFRREMLAAVTFAKATGLTVEDLERTLADTK